MDKNELKMKDFELLSGDMRPLTDIVYEKLKSSIIVGNFAPGERISERKLSELMGTSTTTIKRALSRLSVEGLVEIMPRKGTYVSRFYLSSIEEIGIIRAALEGVAVKLATVKVTEEELTKLRQQIGIMETYTDSGDLDRLVEANSEFHRMIRKIARNLYMSQLSNTVHSFDINVRKRALMNPEEARRGINEHRAIFQAIADRNGDFAEELIKEHILRTSLFVVREMKDEIQKREAMVETPWPKKNKTREKVQAGPQQPPDGCLKNLVVSAYGKRPRAAKKDPEWRRGSFLADNHRLGD